MIPWLAAGAPFPPVARALVEPNGLLAASAEVSPQRLIEAYQRGIFPWYSKGEPVLWWSPDPRMVLFTGELRVSRSLRKQLRAIAIDSSIEVRLDRDFAHVMRACAAPRKGQEGTWITEEIIHAYVELHGRSLAHSIEVWSEGECIGGLYGVSIGRMFFGESMFSHMANASKIALATLVGLLVKENVPVIDCQQRTPHLSSLGARDIARSDFCLLVAHQARADPIDWSRYADRPLNELLLND